MDKNSTLYVFGYAAVMTLIVAVLLTFTSVSLQPLKDANELNNKKKEILGCVNPEAKAWDNDKVAAEFDKGIEQVMININGDILEITDVNPIDIDVKKEKKVASDQQRLPIFVATAEGKKSYIIPVRGSGLWDEIWGFIALGSDANTITGVSFDHAGETPGLGAEIKDNKTWKNQFLSKKLFNKEGEFVSVDVVKGGVKIPDHQVDGISGATVTGVGVADMMKGDMSRYVNYLKQL